MLDRNIQIEDVMIIVVFVHDFEHYCTNIFSFVNFMESQYKFVAFL